VSDDDSVIGGIATHFALLSMMAIGGGVIMLAPDIQRYVVDLHHWITAEQFAAAYTIAQASPGPNLLYVTLVGWWAGGWAGALVATLAIIVPPATLTLVLLRASRAGGVSRFGRALQAGLVPVSVGLLGAGGFVLMKSVDSDWRQVAISCIAVLALVKTRINPVWLIGAGAVCGIVGLV
jgi:chromate transporter